MEIRRLTMQVGGKNIKAHISSVKPDNSETY